MYKNRVRGIFAGVLIMTLSLFILLSMRVYASAAEEDTGKWELIKETLTTDQGSVVTEYEYNSERRLTKEKTTYIDGWSQTTDYEYNSEGRLIKEKHTSADGEVSSFSEYDNEGHMIKELSGDRYTEYKYDSNGNEIYMLQRYHSDGDICYYSMNEYDEAGRLSLNIHLIKYRGWTAANGIFAEKYDYDANGNMIRHIEIKRSIDDGYIDDLKNVDEIIDEQEIRESLAQKELYYIYQYEYDNSGSYIKKKIEKFHNPIDYYDTEDHCKEVGYEEYDQNGKLVKKTAGGRLTHENIYYDNGNPKKEIKYDNDGNYEYVKEYDVNGREIKEVEYSDGVEVWCAETEYDDRGNVIKTTVNKGSIFHKKVYSVFEYDSSDNMVKRITYDEEGAVVSDWYTYEYDSFNNKRKETEYRKDGTVKTYRVYEYAYVGGKKEDTGSTTDGELAKKVEVLAEDGILIVDYSETSLVSPTVFETLAGTNKTITFASGGISWEFNGSNIDASAVKTVDLVTTINLLSKEDCNVSSQVEGLIGKGSSGLVIQFADNGKLPGKAKIRLKVDDTIKDYIGTSGLEIYYWDTANNSLVSIASNVEIDKNNEIVFEIDHCSYYIVKGRNLSFDDKDNSTENKEGKRVLLRLYNPNSGEHFYTSKEKEKDSLVKAGWTYEGEGWTAPITGVPVYRLYNENAGDHHYTTSKRERDKLIETGWKDEGIGWYSAPKDSGKPLYRLYNPNATGAGSHHYTTSTRERDKLVEQGWIFEGIGWYGL